MGKGNISIDKSMIKTIFEGNIQFRLFAVLCGYPHKNQCGLELKIILSIENDEEPIFYCSCMSKNSRNYKGGFCKYSKEVYSVLAEVMVVVVIGYVVV